MKKVIFIFVLLFLSFGVSVDVSVAQQWKVYTTADGLIENSICSIREDKKGYLWFTTGFAGASRYDGVRFQNLQASDGLASDNIYFTLADKAGNVWFATDRGVSRYDGKEFQNFTMEDGLAGNNVTFIMEYVNGNLWFVTDRGVSIYDGKIFDDSDVLADNNVTFILKGRNGNLWWGTKGGAYKNNSKIKGVLEEANISFILEDRSGNLWFATTDRGVIRYDGKDSLNFTTKDGLVNDSIQSILEDSRGDLWFGTDKGISRYDGKNFENFTEINNSIALDFVESILEDSDGNLWFGTANGACKYTMERLQQFTDENGLADNSIEVIMEDKEGNLWFGMVNGVSKYDGKVFENFMVGNSILSMLQDSKGYLWFGTESGVSKYDGTNFKPINEENPQMNTAVIAILEDRVANLWFATSEGVIKYNTSEEVIKGFLPLDDVSEMLMDRDDNLWLGSWTDGIHKYEKTLRPIASLRDGKSRKHYTIKNAGPASNHITWILETQGGNLWFGFEGEMTQTEGGARGGVCRFDGTDFKNFTTDNGLPSDSIEVALEDSKGNLWFGTADKGVVKYNGSSSDESLFFQTITKADGLISNNVRSILSDSAGNIWFGTDEGVSKYDSKHFQTIRLKDRLTLGYIRTIFEDRNGTMWFITTHDGVIRYTPPAKEIRPRIHLTQIEADKIYYNVDEIRVPSTTKRITFEYKGVSFNTKPNKMLYTYQLEGHDGNWHTSTDGRSRYENLKPGHYQFKVKAIDEDLHYSDLPATVDIDIFRPFYLTLPFVISIIFGGICLLGGGGYLIAQLNKQRRISAQLRERLRKQEEAERIQAAMMRALRQLVAGVAHEFNNLIGPISSNNDISSRTISKIKEILFEESPLRLLTVMENINQTNKIASERIATIVTNLRRFVRLDEAEWQFADIHEGIDNVIALMESEFSSRIKITRDYSDIPKIYCSPSSLNQVFMSKLKNASEAIEGEGEVKIRTYAQQEHVKIEISDTGKGIPEEHYDRIFEPGFTKKDVGVGVGLGLSICKKIIVDEHKGRIDVSSELGKGTTFTITLPQYHNGEEKTQ